MIKLLSQYSHAHEKVEITAHSEISLSDLLEVMEKFLQAAGYSFYGTLDIVPSMEEEAKNPDSTD